MLGSRMIGLYVPMDMPTARPLINLNVINV